MDCQQLKEGLENYYVLYQKGLKKQANQYIEHLAKEIQALDHTEKEMVLYRFAQDLCDENEYQYLENRGNGSIPFALFQCLREWLYQRCLENKMPELRWFYQLYSQDKTGYQYAFEFLETAYEHQECDPKTVNLLFAAYIETLAWGAHHFPKGCIITSETREDAFRNCKKILTEKHVDNRLQAQLDYYTTLYSCYDNYVNDSKTKDFTRYCDEANLKFYESKAYYYEK